MPTSSLAVANYFVKKSIDTGTELTPMKVIKMVYIAHGWYLAIKDEPLINEAVEAWKYGPVIPKVYYSFRHFRDQQITKMAEIVYGDKIITPIIDDLETSEILSKVWEQYREFNGSQLSTITHKDNTPWYITRKSHIGSDIMQVVIPNEIIKNHYRKLANDRIQSQTR